MPERFFTLPEGGARTRHFVNLIESPTPVAKDVTFGEVKIYTDAAAEADGTPDGSRQRRKAQKLRRSMAPAGEIQNALWLIPTIAVLGTITFLTGNEALQTIQAPTLRSNSKSSE